MPHLNLIMKPIWFDPVIKTELDLATLSIFQQLLLITDGTLTKILEVYIREPLQVVKLEETILDSPKAIPALEVQPGEELIERKILLQGEHSQKNWLYAESLIVPRRLEPIFYDRLVTSREPIGKLWLEHRAETFKEVITSSREPAAEVAPHFHLTPTDSLLYRTFRVSSNHQPIMLITEKFPESFYVNGIK